MFSSHGRVTEYTVIPKKQNPITNYSLEFLSLVWREQPAVLQALPTVCRYALQECGDGTSCESNIRLASYFFPFQLIDMDDCASSLRECAVLGVRFRKGWKRGRC
jgi:hypothetical protein